MSGLTTLGADYIEGGSTLTLAAALSSTQLCLIDDELMLIDGSSTTPTVTTGLDGTTNASHSSGATVYQVLHVTQSPSSVDVYYLSSGVQSLKNIAIGESSGGSSDGPLSWCSIALPSETLTATSAFQNWTGNQITIHNQSADDSFSLDGSNNLISKNAGNFQAGAWIGNPGASLDTGSSVQRWLGLSLGVGDILTGQPPGAIGMDGFIPLLSSSADPADVMEVVTVSMPAYCAASVPILRQDIGVSMWLVGGFGSDSVPVSFPDLLQLYFWQL